MDNEEMMRRIKNYHERTAQRSAYTIAEFLREADEGTVITIRELAEGHIRPPFIDPDLTLLHDLVLKRAEKLRIELEPLECEDHESCQPYDRPHAVHNTKAQIRCPYCGSTDTAEYIYGYTPENESLLKKIEEGKAILVEKPQKPVYVAGWYVQKGPGRHCNTCRLDFAGPPVLWSSTRRRGSDYRAITQSVTFSEGGCFDGYDEITVTKNEEGASVHLDKTLIALFGEENIQITHQKWEEILDTLYCRLYVHEWNRSYVDPHVLDGTQWSLKIQLKDGRSIEIFGSNAYPPCYDELRYLFSELGW